MNVVCVGAGYVGTVTAAAFAVLGHSVTLIDIDRNKLEAIRRGVSPIYEPYLSEIIGRCADRSLFADSDYGKVAEAEAVFICVGTPSKADSTADLVYVRGAAEQIGKHLDPKRYTVIVNKSTVPVGTSDLVASILEDASGLTHGVNFDVVSNPEFLREGYAVEDVFYPDRIVIGTGSDRAENVMKALYAPLLTRASYAELGDLLPYLKTDDKKPPVWLRTTPQSSELIKYASNAFLAVKISYINEMARLCDALGASVKEVAAGMGLDSRIGGKFLQVSSGWSGSCFPKDTAELLATSRKYGCEQQVVAAAVEANFDMHLYCVQKLQARLKTMQGKRIGVLGLTFKPNTDDVRKTQASVILRKLSDMGCHVKAHDPQGMELFAKLHPDLAIEYCDTPESTTSGADAILLLTDWSLYLEMDWENAGGAMRRRYILDTRNALDAGRMREWGWTYEGLGI
ncbi:UDP-glucose dehydrogenase family protein [Cohnella candidum]|uniref:UDP-glucose 6-dehydrogenase n=1 Tax=Cohnella candidum TaxID=2674991 RepID=A0A3G3JVA5_9BACL|nr:UDP-glucose/GDP-mannose dehydrogenase family protein [Cohnella candidum]AYQ71439.1 UDP-glucose/GDP-mannose dehydrogenase family protein [Cohnella candidum]